MLRPGIKIAATVFVLVALAHGLRLAFLGQLTAGAWQPAHWISLLGVILPLVVAGLLLLEDRGSRRH